MSGPPSHDICHPPLERDRKQGTTVFAGDSLAGGWHTLADDPLLKRFDIG